MEIVSAKDISLFLENNSITKINLMGGEFYCHPQWEQCIHELIKNIEVVRLVTNGDWAGSEIKKEIVEFALSHPQIYFAISKDSWHTNKYIDEAEEILSEHGVLHYFDTGEDTGMEYGIVPIGRGESSFGFYSMFGCYCKNPNCETGFLIDEDGEIYKCPFGIWDYANIRDYINGGFDEKYKEIDYIFNKVFIGNCRTCIQSHRLNGRGTLKI